MTKPEIRSAKGFVPSQKGRTSPAEKAIAEAGPDYYSIRRASEIVGVHIETVRRLLRSDKITAPSEVLIQGDTHIWLLTEEDLILVGIHFNARKAVREEFARKYNGEIPPLLLNLLEENE